mmetsp:Transcript_73257/g.160372  ORF Transcript_73257/g.160372 Transcript_73257/m.160372 type:complete len:882 (+) Transcript_73257:62-2707(+)
MLGEAPLVILGGAAACPVAAVTYAHIRESFTGNRRKRSNTMATGCSALLELLSRQKAKVAGAPSLVRDAFVAGPESSAQALSSSLSGSELECVLEGEGPKRCFATITDETLRVGSPDGSCMQSVLPLGGSTITSHGATQITIEPWRYGPVTLNFSNEEDAKAWLAALAKASRESAPATRIGELLQLARFDERAEFQLQRQLDQFKHDQAEELAITKERLMFAAANESSLEEALQQSRDESQMWKNKYDAQRNAVLDALPVPDDGCVAPPQALVLLRQKLQTAIAEHAELRRRCEEAERSSPSHRPPADHHEDPHVCELGAALEASRAREAAMEGLLRSSEEEAKTWQSKAKVAQTSLDKLKQSKTDSSKEDDATGKAVPSPTKGFSHVSPEAQDIAKRLAAVRASLATAVEERRFLSRKCALAETAENVLTERCSRAEARLAEINPAGSLISEDQHVELVEELKYQQLQLQTENLALRDAAKAWEERSASVAAQLDDAKLQQGAAAAAEAGLQAELAAARAEVDHLSQALRQAETSHGDLSARQGGATSAAEGAPLDPENDEALQNIKATLEEVVQDRDMLAQALAASQEREKAHLSLQQELETENARLLQGFGETERSFALSYNEDDPAKAAEASPASANATYNSSPTGTASAYAGPGIGGPPTNSSVVSEPLNLSAATQSANLQVTTALPPGPATRPQAVLAPTVVAATSNYLGGQPINATSSPPNVHQSYIMQAANTTATTATLTTPSYSRPTYIPGGSYVAGSQAPTPLPQLAPTTVVMGGALQQPTPSQPLTAPHLPPIRPLTIQALQPPNLYPNQQTSYTQTVGAVPAPTMTALAPRTQQLGTLGGPSLSVGSPIAGDLRSAGSPNATYMSSTSR